MTDEDLDALRKKVDQHLGNAKARPLLELATALTDQWWRAGPGSQASRPYLDEGIQVLEEAYLLLEPGTFMCGQVASQLGCMLAIRHSVDFSSDEDRERGIPLLNEALTFPQLPQMLQTQCRLMLGQLLLSRLLRYSASSDFLQRLVSSGLSSEETGNAERAVDCFRRILDEPVANTDMTRTAEVMLGMAEAFQKMVRSPGVGLDVGQLIQAMTSIQTLQQEAAARPKGFGYGYRPNPFQFEGDDFARKPPMERPVSVVDGLSPAAGTHPLRQQASPPVSAATYRMAMLDKLQCAGLAGVIAFLDERAVLPAVEIVDDVVALGSLLVEAPDAVGTDRVLFAVALFLRAIGQGDGGWGADDGGADDAQAAADNLLIAGDALLNERADAVVLAFRLAFRLDSYRSALDTQSRLAERFAAVTDALREIPADGLLYSASECLLLLSTVTGRFTFAAPASPLPVRILVVAEDPIREPAIVSYVSSATQLVELAKRNHRVLAEKVVFVSNPRRDRQHATVDALTLRRSFYPGSIGLGETIEDTNGVGTAVELRKNLGASLLQLGCGITADGGLELADSEVLEAAEIAGGDPPAAGGLAILPPTAKGVAALTDALLASRFVGVIAFRNEVPGSVASLMYFLVHRLLVDENLDPAAALSAVRQWMADPDREPVPDLPGLYNGAATTAELANPAYWGALIHYGVSWPQADQQRD